MEVNDKMLEAAMKKAVETGLVAKYMEPDTYLKTWDVMKKCLQAAIDTQEGFMVKPKISAGRTDAAVFDAERRR